MLAVQLERKLGVVDIGRLPGIGRMTGSAVGAELAFVEVILLVAGVTILGSGAQV